MAARKKTVVRPVNDIDFSKMANSILEVSLENEISDAFLPYAQTTIEERAIPDIRDGLKPVQRKILYAMYSAGFLHNKPYAKSLKTIGEAMKYYTHGDSSLYEAAGRMTRSYTFNIPLVDGHGSFGSAPPDGMAASRYTEMRLQEYTEDFLTDIPYGAVEMLPNFDSTLMEPSCLPVTFPILLVNGTNGIATGFACNFAPHNPGESIDAVIAQIKKPSISLDELMKIMPGPDFPTGGEIVGVDGIEVAYGTNQENAKDPERAGKGRCRIRSRYRIEKLPRGRSRIEFYEVPYDQPHDKIVEELRKFSLNKEIVGMTNVINLSDRLHQTLIVVDVKSGVDAEKVAQSIMAKSSTLTKTFAFNHTAIVNGAPRIMSLKDIIQSFIDFRREVVLKRSSFLLGKMKAKRNLLEGFDKCLLDIDAVIKIIRTSEGAEAARTGLMKKFKLDEEQARYVGGMKLFQLTKGDRLEIKKSIDELNSQIAVMQERVDDPGALDKEVIAELRATRKKIDKPRMSVISGVTLADAKESEAEVLSLTEEDLAVEDAPCTVTLMDTGKMQRTKLGKAPMGGPKNGFVIDSFDTTNMSKLIIITNQGRSFRVPALAAPESTVGEADLGSPLKTKERAIAVMPFVEGMKIAITTKNGLVKVVDCATLTKTEECPVMGVGEEDEITSAKEAKDGVEFVFVSTDSSLLRFKVSDIRPQGRTGQGVVGGKAKEGQGLLFAAVVDADGSQVTTSTGGSLKTTDLGEFPPKGRGSLGVRSHRFLAGEDKLTAAFVGHNPCCVINGKEVGLPAPAKRDASGTKGDYSQIRIGCAQKKEIASGEEEKAPAAPKARKQSARKAKAVESKE